MIRVRLGDPLPPAAPEAARPLARAAAAGVRVAGTVLLLDVADGSDVALAAALGPLPPGLLDLVPLNGEPVRDLPVADVAALARGLRSLAGAPGVLVQPQVAAVHAGTALLRTGPYDVVRAHEVGAEHDVRVLHVPRLPHAWSRPHRGADPWRTPLPPWGMRLSRVLRRLRAVLPGEELDVAWADDGRRLHVLGLVPPT